MRFFLFLLTACAPEENKLDSGTAEPSSEPSSEEPSSEPSEEPEPSSEPSEEPEPLILDEGTWNLSTPQLLSDSCGINGYQEVSEFVPSSLIVDNSEEDSFLLKPDSLVCERTGLDFSCDSVSISESALAGTASMQILSEISGTIISEDSFEMIFDVTIESCEGGGCFLVELALTFPCPVTLKTNGSI